GIRDAAESCTCAVGEAGWQTGPVVNHVCDVLNIVCGVDGRKRPPSSIGSISHNRVARISNAGKRVVEVVIVSDRLADGSRSALPSDHSAQSVITPTGGA